jgi:multidrug efflux system outer membrane protein
VKKPFLLLAVTAILSGCAAFQHHDQKTEAMLDAEAKLPKAWQAPLPHDGQVTDLKRWWQQFDDPLLAELVEAGQAVSPTIAAARSRLENARATSTGATAALLPSLDIVATGNRGKQDVRMPTSTTVSGGVAASWELDVFGGVSAGSDAAAARLTGAEAEWHAARISVAAEIASAYVGLRACEAQFEHTRVDAESRKATARLTAISHEAGLESPANAALTQASAAQGNSIATLQGAQCEIQTKVLVALTAIDESSLRQKLESAGRGRIPQPAQIAVAEIPANVLAQRPDLYSAALSVMAANADVTQLEALRLPRITLAGSISHARSELDSGNVASGEVWNIGPVMVTLPLFDAGLRRANVAAGRVRYEEAATLYAARLRNAIREVEEALITLDSAAARDSDAHTALNGFNFSFKSVEVRQQYGMASLFELEDARRSLSLAKRNLVDVQRDRVIAWINLYRALGGGWTAADQDKKQPDPEQKS